MSSITHNSIETEAIIAALRAELEAVKRERDELKASREPMKSYVKTEHKAKAEWVKLAKQARKQLTACQKERDELVESLEKLARLGNEPHYGNSIGNRIAQDALAKVGKGEK